MLQNNKYEYTKNVDTESTCILKCSYLMHANFLLTYSYRHTMTLHIANNSTYKSCIKYSNTISKS